MITRAKEILDLEIQALQNLPLDENKISQAVDMIVNCKGRIIFLAMGKALKISEKIASTLSSTGTSSIAVNAAEAHHGDLGIIKSSDIIIAISNSGKTQEVISALNLCKRAFSCYMVAITSDQNSTIGLMCDLVLEIGKIKEACPFGLAPTCSTTAMLVLGDIISVLVMEKKEFTIENYGLLHHGGYIGDIIRSK